MKHEGTLQLYDCGAIASQWQLASHCMLKGFHVTERSKLLCTVKSGWVTAISTILTAPLAHRLTNLLHPASYTPPCPTPGPSQAHQRARAQDEGPRPR